jgi:hypothetical protein
MSYFTETAVGLTDFRKILRYQISWKSVQWGANVFHADGRTGRYDEVIVALRTSAYAPKTFMDTREVYLATYFTYEPISVLFLAQSCV